MTSDALNSLEMEISLPIAGPAFTRPDAKLVHDLRAVSSATASATLHKMGIRQTFIAGPKCCLPGTKIVGPAITLQFMPQREDIGSGMGQEYAEKQTALWAIFDSVKAGDVLVVQAYGDMYTGCLGEMLVTSFKGHNGEGIVVDGCIRDWPRVKQLDVPIWSHGFTPNYASQATLFPWAYNVPIACSRVLVLPGDIIIADDDGAVVIPRKIAAEVLQSTLELEDWESFSRLRMAQGGALMKYYPLNEEGRQEYELWRMEQQRNESDKQDSDAQEK